MSNITAAMVKELRETTGAGMMVARPRSSKSRRYRSRNRLAAQEGPVRPPRRPGALPRRPRGGVGRWPQGRGGRGQFRADSWRAIRVPGDGGDHRQGRARRRRHVETSRRRLSAAAPCGEDLGDRCQDRREHDAAARQDCERRQGIIEPMSTRRPRRASVRSACGGAGVGRQRRPLPELARQSPCMLPRPTRSPSTPPVSIRPRSSARGCCCRQVPRAGQAGAATPRSSNRVSRPLQGGHLLEQRSSSRPPDGRPTIKEAEGAVGARSRSRLRALCAGRGSRRTTTLPRKWRRRPA